VCCTGLIGVKPLRGSRQLSPAGTGLTGGAHRSDRCWSVDSRFGVPLRSRVGRLCVGSYVQWHPSSYVGLANLGSESRTCVGSRVHLVGASISFEKNFYRLPFTPPSLVRRIGPSDEHSNTRTVCISSTDGPQATCVVWTVRDVQADGLAHTQTVRDPYTNGPTNPFRPETDDQTNRNEDAQEHPTNTKNPRTKGSMRTVRGL
jgi:hypothetical protein